MYGKILISFVLLFGFSHLTPAAFGQPKSTNLTFATFFPAPHKVYLEVTEWAALSPEHQKVVEKVSAEWIEKAGASWDAIDKTGREFTLKRGNQVISLSKEEEQKWIKACSPLYNEYLNSMKSKGLPGEEALKFCQEYLKQNQK